MDENLRKRLSKADELLTKGVPYSAAAHLGELWAYAEATGGPLRVELRAELTARMATVDVEHLHRDLASKMDRMHRILFASGNQFCVEELTLLLSMRADVAWILALLADFRPETTLKLPLEDIDRELQGIARSSKNKSSYRTALASVASESLAELPGVSD